MPPPNQPKTPGHSIRVDDELWEAMLRATADQGETITDVAVRAFRRYVREHPSPPEDRSNGDG